MQVRADLNVPLDKDLNITDDTRIRAAIPTLKYLTDNGAKVLLTSHLVSALLTSTLLFRLACWTCDCTQLLEEHMWCRDLINARAGKAKGWTRRQV